jgi:DNA-binding beta-propeller fold protein YncE
LNIAQHPGSLNIAYLNDLQSPTPAFSPSLSVNSPPTDWTIAINYTGGGLSKPQSVAVDASGNVWAANPSGNSVTELSNTGAAISGGTGFTAGGALSAPYGIAIDLNGYAWVTSSGNNQLAQIAPGGATYLTFTPTGLSTPEGIAIDGADNVWVANSGDSTISGFTNAGSALPSSPYSGGGLSTPTSVAVSPK